tara:strand:- start:4195 stop:5088 length:894 start_codon:yes stop_codon:yes gene_type:complete
MTILEDIIGRVEELNPLHAKKIRKNIAGQNEEFTAKAEKFLSDYLEYLAKHNKDLDHAIECYLKLIDDMLYETIRFMTSKEYSNSSFEDVNARIYNNPEVMEYHMQGLLLSQFLWIQHYKILEFFIDQAPRIKKDVKQYLEVGAGHGIFLNSAIDFFPEVETFTAVDISASSIEIAKNFVDNPNIRFVHSDILKFQEENKFDFVTMGEVLEHVEDPIELLKKLKSLLKKDGVAFITTPTNAPAIDHIYLFRNDKEIKEVIHAAGFEILEEIQVPSEDLKVDEAHEKGVSVMYGAFLK